MNEQHSVLSRRPISSVMESERFMSISVFYFSTYLGVFLAKIIKLNAVRQNLSIKIIFIYSLSLFLMFQDGIYTGTRLDCLLVIFELFFASCYG